MNAPRLRPLALGAIFLGLLSDLSAQEVVVEETPSAPKLTPDQVANLTSQLKALETQIQQQRGDNLGQVLTKLRAAAGSSSSALKLFHECEILINVDRKDLDSDEAKRQEERLERGSQQRADADEDRDGDIGLAVQLMLQYLVLTLEAHESKDTDAMVSKLETYVQQLVASSEKLVGRSAGIVNGNLGGNNPIVRAYQLERYLDAENWSNSPGNIGGFWTETFLPWYLENKPEELPTIWDRRLSAEAAMRKGDLSEAEYALWLANDLPALKWDRAEFLLQNGQEPVQAMADMLNLIKENPGHADAVLWLQKMKQLVDESSAG